MSVENVIQQLADTDKIHTDKVMPAAKATETAAHEVLGMTRLDEHYRMPAASGVVEAIFAYTNSIRAKIKSMQPDTIDEHANRAMNGYTRVANGTQNEHLTDAVEDSMRCISNDNDVRSYIGELEEVLYKLEGDILSTLAAASVKLTFPVVAIEGAAQAIYMNGEQAVEASQAYVIQITQ